MSPQKRLLKVTYVNPEVRKSMSVLLTLSGTPKNLGGLELPDLQEVQVIPAL